jgi:hypothetical protein
MLARPHRGAALHQIRELPEPSPDGYEIHRVRDAAGHEVEVSNFEVPEDDQSADDKAFPMPRWEPRAIESSP